MQRHRLAFGDADVTFGEEGDASPCPCPLGKGYKSKQAKLDSYLWYRRFVREADISDLQDLQIYQLLLLFAAQNTLQYKRAEYINTLVLA